MNYPLNATDTNPDMDFGGGDLDLFQVPIPKGGAPKVVKLPLYVYDYAASATIEITMPYRKTTFTASRRIPLDENGNGMPDAGWYLQSGAKVLETTLTAAGDVDTDPPGTGEPVDSSFGDGLSNFEEYRGFIFGGSYQRLDPNEKDLVMVIDSSLLTDAEIVRFLTSVAPYHKRYAELSEVSGTDYADRQVLKTKPVVNTNRAGVPGARISGQRGVRVTQQDAYPPAFLTAGTGFPIWQMGILGITWVDGMSNLDVFNSPANASAAIQSPDGTQFVELYPQTLRNHGISTSFSNPSVYHDASGAVVPNCNVTNTANCDFWDVARGMIIPRRMPAGNYILNTVLDPVLMPSDYYSKYARTCAAQDELLPQGMTAAQMHNVHTALFGHELAHALHVEHQTDPLADCRSIMYDNMLPGSDRRTWADMLPLPTSYGDLAQAMRLWQ